jgi:hypothetical protein
MVYAEAFDRDADPEDFSRRAMIAHERGHQILARDPRPAPRLAGASPAAEGVLASLLGAMVTGQGPGRDALAASGGLRQSLQRISQQPAAERVVRRRRYPVPRRFQFRTRTVLVGIAVLSIAMAYVGSYDRLKRRGMRQAVEYGYPGGFLYVPFEEAAASQDLTRHYAWAAFYEPLNSVDRTVFGGPSHWVSFLWRLSG